MQASYDAVADEFAAVNKLILSQLQSEVPLVVDISQYLVTSGGKRIRPLVSLLCAGALGDAGNQRQVQLATAVEFLHTATLLHDDVVDMSTLRRGKPTANANWDNASSVLVGDFVYSRAFQLMVAVGELEVMQIMSETTSKIAEGEVRQLTLIGDLSLSESDYFDVIQRKTAQLFEGACESAAVIAGADADTRKSVCLYGRHLGLAFQLVDDYLDYAGNDDELGKHVGDDLSEGKLTLPLIEALRLTRDHNPRDHQLLVDAVKNKDLGMIADVVRITREIGALEETLQRASYHAEQGKQALTGIPPSNYKSALADISDFVISRTH